MKLNRLKTLIFSHLQHLPMPSKFYRPWLVKRAGVNVVNPRKTFIGERVIFDTNFPEDITIEEGVRITANSIIVSHFLNTATGTYYRGKVRIRKNAYLGVSTIVCKPVVIGEGAVVGAGSVVLCDIPDYQVWAGNPAKFVKQLDHVCS